MSISKSSYGIVGFCVILFLLVWIFFAFSWFLFLLLLALIFICRNTQSNIVCTDEKAILAPIAGTISKIENIKHKDLGDCIELSIQNALYNEGVIRASSAMHIQSVKFRHGLFCASPNLAKFSERVFILARNNDKNFALRISAGSLERKITLYDTFGEFKAGDELGFSLNSTLSLLLPKDTRLLIGVGDETKSCALLGYFS